MPGVVKNLRHGFAVRRIQFAQPVDVRQNLIQIGAKFLYLGVG